MSYKDHHHRHRALMLLACAFAFVYLLAWEFQWWDITRRWNGKTKQDIAQTKSNVQKMPVKLEMIDEQTVKNNISVWKTNTVTNTSIIPNKEVIQWWSWVKQISFTSLNAIPLSFIRLWIKSTAGIMMDTQRIIVTNSTNTIKRTWETKTMTLNQIKQIWLTVDSLTFYNDPSWTNILVIIEVVHNQQSILIQIPYIIWRDDKAHINILIAQLTQK